MMVRWTRGAFADLERVAAFLASRPAVQAIVVALLTEAPDRLAIYPRLGMRLENFEPREIRRLIVGDYELRYEIAHDAIVVLRIFHGLEDR